MVNADERYTVVVAGHVHVAASVVLKVVEPEKCCLFFCVRCAESIYYCLVLRCRKKRSRLSYYITSAPVPSNASYYNQPNFGQRPT